MQAPKFPSVIRNVQKNPRQFKYSHKFYDNKGEAWEERKRRIAREIAIERGEELEAEGFVSAGFRKAWTNRENRRVAGKASYVRLFFILLALVGITYYIVSRLNNITQ